MGNPGCSSKGISNPALSSFGGSVGGGGGGLASCGAAGAVMGQVMQHPSIRTALEKTKLIQDNANKYFNELKKKKVKNTYNSNEFKNYQHTFGQKAKSIEGLIMIYLTYEQLYQKYYSNDKSDQHMSASIKELEDEIKKDLKEIQLNNRKTYYEHQETASQKNILRYILISYWILFVIFIGIVLFVAYDPSMKYILGGSAAVLFIMPLIMNKIVHVIVKWIYEMIYSLPRDVYTNL